MSLLLLEKKLMYVYNFTKETRPNDLWKKKISGSKSKKEQTLWYKDLGKVKLLVVGVLVETATAREDDEGNLGITKDR